MGQGGILARLSTAVPAAVAGLEQQSLTRRAAMVEGRDARSAAPGPGPVRMMGLVTPSSSRCLASNSSFSDG